jgi:hypothetical protein
MSSMVTARVVEILARVARWTAGAVLFALGLLGASPTATQWLGVASVMWAWLQHPAVFIPLLVAGTVLLWHDILSWNLKRRWATPLSTSNTPLREAFNYLRFESRWAMQFKDSAECAVAAGREIEDQMSMARLPIWGRDKAFTYSSLQIIHSSFWNGMTLNKGSL